MNTVSPWYVVALATAMSFMTRELPAATTTVITTATGSVTVGKDTVLPGDLTLVLRDFNDGVGHHSGLSNNTGRPQPTWVSNYDGYVVFSVEPFYDEASGTYSWDGSPQHDPRVTFNSQPYSVLTYNYVRTRQSYQDASGGALATAPRSEMWPHNPVGPTQVIFGTLSTSFQEFQRAWVDPTNSNIQTATVGGFRWDPVVGGLTTDQAVRFNLDYFMVDRGRVQGFEFDTVGADFMGWSRTQITNLATTLNASGDSVLSGTTDGVDPYLSRSGLTLDTSIYKFVEIRLQIDAPTSLQFFWSTDVAGNTGYTESKSIKLSTGDTNFHTYLLDFSNDSTWTGNLKQFRIDLGGSTGIDFEVDYIRFREIGSVVPEPSLSVLICGSLLLVSLRRSRHPTAA